MAQHEADREDFLRDATALVPRFELILPGELKTVLAGFHNDGRLSIYFGADPAYHFDAARRLRRAFVAGQLYRSQGVTMARLTRVRTAEATELQRYDLTAPELAEFLARLHTRMQSLAAAMAAGTTQVLAQEPTGDDYVVQLRLAAAGIAAAGPKLSPAIRR